MGAKLRFVQERYSMVISNLDLLLYVNGMQESIKQKGNSNPLPF